jgi:hypothetical protein
MIVEVRRYTVKPDLRSRFLRFFEREAVPLQRSLGIRVVGPFVDLEHPDVFVWLRAFPSLDARERMKHALYEGGKWKRELEAVAMPMLESWDVILTETGGFLANDLDADATGHDSGPVLGAEAGA